MYRGVPPTTDAAAALAQREAVVRHHCVTSSSESGEHAPPYLQDRGALQSSLQQWVWRCVVVPQ